MTDYAKTNPCPQKWEKHKSRRRSLTVVTNLSPSFQLMSRPVGSGDPRGFPPTLGHQRLMAHPAVVVGVIETTWAPRQKCVAFFRLFFLVLNVYSPAYHQYTKSHLPLWFLSCHPCGHSKIINFRTSHIPWNVAWFFGGFFFNIPDKTKLILGS